MRQKARMTITLSNDVLKRIDLLIDGKDIRNRSHAIEHLVRKALTPKIDTAVLLAGAPEQKNIPALSMIGDTQLIIHTLMLLKANGIDTVYVLAGQYTDHIRCVVSDGSKYNIAIHYIDEPVPLGTAGSLKYLEDRIVHDFLVLHADVLTTIQISSFLEFHTQEGATATMALKLRHNEKKYGQVILQGNRIVRFIPQSTEKGFNIINTGVYVLKPDVFAMIKKKTHADLETAIFPELAKRNELAAYIFQGIWFDISRSDDYNEALKRWNTEQHRDTTRQ